MKRLGILMLVAAGLAADAAGEEFVVLQAETIYPGDGTVVENGSVLVRGNEIVAVGPDLAIPDGARVLSAEGATVTAGLIDAGAMPGFRPLQANNEQSSEVVPRTRVADTVNFLSHDFRELLGNGVTTVHLASDSTSVIGARGALMKTGGEVGLPEVFRPVHGVHGTIAIEAYFLPSNRPPFGTPIGTSRRPTTRMGLMWAFRKAFYDAIALRDGVAPPAGNPVARTEEDLRVLIEVLEGKIPFHILARGKNDILRAVRLSEEFGFDFILEEGLEAHRCLEVLKSQEIPVIYGPIMMNPIGTRLTFGGEIRVSLRTPKRLAEEGIVFALSGRDLLGEDCLPFQACYAMRYGLGFDDALRAVTSTPARLLGIEDRVGAIRPGLEADLVLWSGKPFDPRTRALAVVIGGKVVHDQRPGGSS